MPRSVAEPKSRTAKASAMPASRSPAVVIVVAVNSSRKSRSASAPRRLRSATDTAGYRTGVLYGAHVSSSGGIDTAIERAVEMRCTAVQVFTQSPRMWRPTAHADDALGRFRERRAQARIRSVVCHAVYLVNLATADDEMYEKSRVAMEATVETACALEADGVVFHVGSHLGAGFEAGVARAVPILRELLDLCDGRTRLLLENTAGAGGTMGRSVAELQAFFDALDAHPSLGVCLDSCHWWASGVDVTDTDALDEALGELDEAIGLDRVRCLHVNDSQTPLASNRDRHAALGEGLIGKGLGTFLAHPAFQDLPAIVETGRDGGAPGRADVDILRQLHRNGMRRARRAGLR
jgi:deoxyribonuclease IV